MPVVKYLILLLIIFFLVPSKIHAFSGPLKVSTQNPRYFTDNSNKVIYLAGLHTWRNFQAIGSDNFNYSNYLNYLVSNNLNFTRLWIWETDSYAAGYGSNSISPLPFVKSGSKYDLNSINQAFYDRLRQHVVDAGNKGIYVSITLFNGWSLGDRGDGNPWPYHPMNSNKNTNNVNGDFSPADGAGYETETLKNSTITEIQKAYVRKVIDTVNDLDNVIFEICNESEGGADYVAWQKNMVEYIHTYESSKPKKHVVGFTHPWDTTIGTLINSSAELVAPGDGDNYTNNPPLNNGTKVIIADTDHLWGLGGNRSWAWQSFTRGINVSYMDCYAENGSLEASQGCPIGFTNSERVSLVKNMGYINTYATKLNLNSAVPSTNISSTSYALVNSDNEYLVYQPNSGAFTLNLSSTQKTYTLEWLNPSSGAVSNGGSVTGGASKTLTPPFSGDAVAYLKASGVLPTPTTLPTIIVTPTPTPTATKVPTPTPVATINSKYDINSDGKIDLQDVLLILAEIFR